MSDERHTSNRSSVVPSGEMATLVVAAGPALVESAEAGTAPGRVISVYERRKALYPQVLWAAMALSVVIHWAAFEAFPTITAEVQTYAANELVAVELPPQVEIPPAPERIARPAIPVAGDTDIPLDVTIALTTFEHNPPELMVPRPLTEATEGEREITDEPTFTPYTVAPLLQNREEAAKAILANYPRMLKEAGLGGEVLMWFFIDKEGVVQEARVAKSSGFNEMDEAATRVASLLEFSPAKNRDVVVPVWVQIPIYFSVAARD